jgi:TolB-like protein
VHYAFGDCDLDLERRELRRGGALAHTRTKVFNVLVFLLENRDRVITRDELLNHSWPGLTVSDATLSSCILSVRRAIGDDGRDPKLIKTLRGQGFRFIGDVATDEHSEDAPLTTANDVSEHDAQTARPAHARENSLSIAVLPFANLNNDPKLNFLGEGLAEDITTKLSRFKAFTVIARNSSFLYRGPDDKIANIAADLQVDYILKGSVRRDDDHFRATTQLIFAPSTKQLWAETFDGPIEQLFALQDEISQKIAMCIKPEIDLAEIRRASNPHHSDLRAQAIAWRARALLDRARLEGKPALYKEGMGLAETAAAQDPQCRQAWWTISVANILVAFARRGGESKAALIRAREAAEELRVLDRNDHSAYMALGWVNYIERDIGRALTNLDHAHSLNPNCTMTLMFLGVVNTAAGEAQTGFNHLRQAVRLSPRDLWLGFMRAAQGLACFALERYSDGVRFSNQAIEREPNAPANHIILAACLVETGDLKGASAAIATQYKINRAFLQEYLNGKRLPYQTPHIAERYTAALRRAANQID